MREILILAFLPDLRAGKLKNDHFWQTSDFFHIRSTAKSEKNKNFKIYRIQILDNPIGML